MCHLLLLEKTQPEAAAVQKMLTINAFVHGLGWARCDYKQTGTHSHSPVASSNSSWLEWRMNHMAGPQGVAPWAGRGVDIDRMYIDRMLIVHNNEPCVTRQVSQGWRVEAVDKKKKKKKGIWRTLWFKLPICMASCNFCLEEIGSIDN